MEIVVFIASLIVLIATCFAYGAGCRRGRKAMKREVIGILKRMRDGQGR